MKLVYKKLGLMWLNTEETLQAATTFIIYHKNKDTRLQIILCKLEIFCFPFIKKWLVILCTFSIIESTLSYMLCLFTGYEKCYSLLNSKYHFDVNKKTELCKWLDTGIFWCLGYAFE